VEDKMPDQITKSWGIPTPFQGIFGGFNVIGMKYVAEDGEVGWHTTSWPDGNPTHDYWFDGQFHEMSMHLMHRLTNENLIEIYGVVKVEQEEKTAILEAIAKWAHDKGPTAAI
jgi:hypothetical protein